VSKTCLTVIVWDNSCRCFQENGPIFSVLNLALLSRVSHFMKKLWSVRLNRSSAADLIGFWESLAAGREVEHVRAVVARSDGRV
jgi:hypothetical protein